MPNFTRKVRQITPAACKGDIHWDELPNIDLSHVLAEEKKDGLRYLYQIAPHGAEQNYLTSRRVSKVTGQFVEKQDKVPHMRDHKFPKAWTDTVFDGEFTCDGISSDTQHSMANGKGVYVVFDILIFNGRNVRDDAQNDRRELLENLAPKFPPFMQLIPQVRGKAAILRLSEKLKKAKAEGLVIKYPHSRYGEGWFKVKGTKEYDVIVWGEEWSTEGKYKKNKWIKSLRIAQVAPNGYAGELPLVASLSKSLGVDVVDVGTTSSGLDESLRAKISANPKKFYGKIAEVECNLRLPSGRLRHSRFIRWREDKNQKDCVYVAATTKD